MCIIIYKPKGVVLPPSKTIKTCFENNPDGCGYMLKTRQGVKINKGYFDVDELINKLFTIKDIQDVELGIHFRITTHGATNALNCHPFAIKRKLKDIRRTQQTAAAAVMHNGVLSSVKVKSNSGLSDTAVYTRDVLNPLKTLNGGALTNSKQASDIINATRGTSRLLIFDGQGVKMFGNWLEDNGVFYSNDSYKARYFDAWNTGWNSFWNTSKPLNFEACSECLFNQECKAGGCYCLTEKQAQEEAAASFDYYTGVVYD